MTTTLQQLLAACGRSAGRLPMPADLTAAERRERLIANAALKGFRVAEDWELQALPWEDLYHAMHNSEQVGPVFVRAERSNHARPHRA